MNLYVKKNAYINRQYLSSLWRELTTSKEIWKRPVPKIEDDLTQKMTLPKNKDSLTQKMKTTSPKNLRRAHPENEDNLTWKIKMT